MRHPWLKAAGISAAAGALICCLSAGIAGDPARIIRWPQLQIGDAKILYLENNLAESDSSSAEQSPPSEANSANQNGAASGEHQYSGLEDVSRIEIEADFADIEILKSDHLYIVTEGLPANNESDGYRSFRFNCSQGLLRIDSETEESMSILSPTAGKIIVNVPDKAESLYAETALGNISAEKLNIQSAEFEADLGNISLNQISGQSLSAECNAGEISADQISFKKAVFINDLGNISVNGRFSDLITAENNCGNVSLFLHQKINPEKAKVELATDLGDLVLNRKKIDGSYTSSGSGMPGVMVNVSLGNIDCRWQ